MSGTQPKDLEVAGGSKESSPLSSPPSSSSNPPQSSEAGPQISVDTDGCKRKRKREAHTDDVPAAKKSKPVLPAQPRTKRVLRLKGRKGHIALAKFLNAHRHAARFVEVLHLYLEEEWFDADTDDAWAYFLRRFVAASALEELHIHIGGKFLFTGASYARLQAPERPRLVMKTQKSIVPALLGLACAGEQGRARHSLNVVEVYGPMEARLKDQLVEGLLLDEIETEDEAEEERLEAGGDADLRPFKARTAARRDEYWLFPTEEKYRVRLGFPVRRA